ncbi:2-oxoglutarate and iron-dependent oxygenase JMJD4 isoform X2 [Petromyzon marinus]|uniref:Jumonji domain-containing protein 4 n=1 Tax=Petromyzon marinus TaxID=7757 RepID=A0AAJ7T7Z0_PETMA|nr:2-oxoglutarate and iron-dependent oxygenase JMJD4 isoform X2 [Petromyzon marinus]
MDRALLEESLGLLSPRFGSPRGGVPPVLPDGTPGYAELWRAALLPNCPRLLPAPHSAAWGSRARWVTPRGEPDLGALHRDFGDAVVPVADCAEREYNSNPKKQMPMREFLSYWQETMSQDHSSSPRPCLYLKDWHMCKTPFHADVFRSYSWSANVCGRKLWLLYPPGQEEALRDHLGNLPYDVTAPDPWPQDAPAKKPAPWDTAGGARSASGAAQLRQRGQKPMEVIQEAGEIIFIPSGWHHQVHNLEDTISINHNWLNGCNIDLVWSFLQSELRAVQKEIGHCRSGMSNWAEQCQCIMKACTGINYVEFYSFMKLIAERRMEFLHERMDIPGPRCAAKSSSTGPDHSRVGEAGEHGELTRLGNWHAAFDLMRVQEVLVALQGDSDFGLLPVDSLPKRPEQLQMDIEHVIGNMGRMPTAEEGAH